jgi:aminopeptidase-like protein
MNASDHSNIDSYAQRAQWIIGLCRNLYPIRGLIASPDLDRAYARLAEEVPGLVVHEYPTGMECEDWIVPPSWRATEGRLEDKSGHVLASLDEHFLFAAAYSEPVDGWFPKSEIKKRMRTRPDYPNAYALEHRNAYDYRLKDWGITLPYRVWQAMSDDELYRVVIKTEVKPGAMRVAEMVLPGRRPETICLCSHMDELCNDGHSSSVLALDVIRQLARRENREFTYQVLLVPEMIGAIFFVLNNRERVAQTAAMLNFETIACGEKWIHKSSLSADSFADAALHLAFQDAGLAYDSVGFFGGYGNDERVYGWPSIGIPGVAIQRYPFPYYHTSHDTPDILNADLIIEALKVTDAFIDILERDYAPSFRLAAQPWLTRHGLYFNHYVEPDQFHRLNNLALFNLDGRRSVSDLAKLAGVPFNLLHEYLEQFVARGIVEKRTRDVPLPAAQFANKSAVSP